MEHAKSPSINCNNKEFIEQSSTQSEDKKKNLSTLEVSDIHHELVSPAIWIPSALFAAFINAFSKEIKSKVSAHHLAAMFLISPSILVTLLVLSLGFWVQSKYYSKQQLDGDNHCSFFQMDLRHLLCKSEKRGYWREKW